MSESGQLLDEVRGYCDPATGEVIQRIPEDLMLKLRAAKLVRGIPGKPSTKTESNATWFVFLDEEIRNRVLTEWRAANRIRKRRRKSASEVDARPSKGRSAPKPAASHGLKSFRQRRKS